MHSNIFFMKTICWYPKLLALMLMPVTSCSDQLLYAARYSSTVASTCY
uniref:Uncharacterized protein n=1 Tax=Arundo donax TaxID=35708 RepID=A0A0A9E8H9_ARUDO